MNKINEYLGPSQKQQLIKNNLKIGQILHIFSKYTNPPKDKFCLIVNIDPFVLFYINSDITNFVRNNPEKFELQIIIPHYCYTFFSKDSYLDCITWEMYIKIDDVVQQIIQNKPFYNIKDELCDRLKQKITNAISKSRIYNPSRRKVIIDNLK